MRTAAPTAIPMIQPLLSPIRLLALSTVLLTRSITVGFLRSTSNTFVGVPGVIAAWRDRACRVIGAYSSARTILKPSLSTGTQLANGSTARTRSAAQRAGERETIIGKSCRGRWELRVRRNCDDRVSKSCRRGCAYVPRLGLETCRYWWLHALLCCT